MPSTPRPGTAPVSFDDATWSNDLQHASTAGRAAGAVWRSSVDRHGLPLTALRACQPDAPDGTSLPGCMKTYIPAPAGPWGAVLGLALNDTTNRARLDVIAFGVRHPPRNSHRPSVYQLAHRRLHGD